MGVAYSILLISWLRTNNWWSNTMIFDRNQEAYSSFVLTKKHRSNRGNPKWHQHVDFGMG